MIRAVLFDFYGTLARAVSWGPTIEEMLSKRGLSLDPDAHQRWRSEVADGMEHLEASSDRERYIAWERERMCRLVEGCGAPPADIEDVAAALYAATKGFTLEAYEEVPDVLAGLRERGVLVVVCSNWDWDLDVALAQAGLEPLVDLAVTSAQAGARKPHPRIYQETLDRCGDLGPSGPLSGDLGPSGPLSGRLEPSQALFVGDTWGPDVEGPLTAGLRPVHIWRSDEPGSEVEPPPLVDGVHRLPDLRGILDLVAEAEPDQAGRNESRT